ncbi:myb-like protein U [Octopus bimaculoides]|uniref:HMG box domain-containing protein n=1 Tax=Octopus bimaculoides TaxID=37653 RepID=A0A0L8G395_OCTBM|nr:myb-like protein U [Octopus bimaculoides]XP_052831204.1 myb-like protein U [Octopus bimaculoides]XP_052831205.1 myb-like protein U [Octopus bimaculoides]XP_052831206.1 myb-like protein U [Octopus bimaculoides]|eukprot:XP_014784497.1 PREDICTED: myb-like protein U [Octopus bimaculoides]
MEGLADRREARRPMNSFFIFCKRHRSMVRSKHPNLDNRSISRILGDLWANLGKEEKQQYTATAKQYKDAFMKANPDYKWHSYEKSNLLLNTSCVPTFRDDQPLPASKPNISSDITNKANKDFNKDCLACYRPCTTNSNNMNLLMMAIEQNATESTCNHLSQTNIKKELPEISADSPDMSMLLSQESAKVSWLSKINLQPDTENSELRLCQNWDFKNKDITQCSCEPSTNSTQHIVKESPPPSTTDNTSPHHHCKDCNESDDNKNHQGDARIDVNWTKSAGLEFQSSFEYPLRDNNIPTRKSKRRNKGAIYKNLIASGALPASRERLAEIQTIYKVTSDDSNDVYDYHQHQPHRSCEQTGRKLQRTMSESDSQLDKRYKTGDFDLEARIATLPACSMDSLGRSRKNSGKQRIYSESSRQTIMSCSTPTIRTDMLLAPPHRRRQPIYPPIVGSRKRKQPRDGIMRIVPLSKEYKHPLANVMKIPLATFYVHPSMKSYQDLQLNKKSDSHDAVTSESEGKDEDCYIASAATPNVANGEENVTAAQALTIDIKCTEGSETLKYSENLQPLSTAATCTKTGGGILTTSNLVTQSRLTFHSNHIPLATSRSLTSNNSNHCCSATYNNSDDNNNKNNNSNINNSSNISYTATCNNNYNNNNNFNCSYNASYIKNNSISANSCNAGYNNNSNNNNYKITFNNNNNDNINNKNSCFAVDASSVNIVTHMDNTKCSGDNKEKPTCPGLEVNQNLHVTGELKVTVEDQSLKRAKLGENPDFKIWISNLAEAAERSGQIPVC